MVESPEAVYRPTVPQSYRPTVRRLSNPLRIRPAQPTGEDDEPASQLQDAPNRPAMLLRQRLHLQQLRLGQQSGERIVERMLERVCRRAQCHVRTQTMKVARGNRFGTLGPTRARRQLTRVLALREQGVDDPVRVDAGEKLYQERARERGGGRRFRD